MITNWHNVTGRNPTTGKPISNDHAGIPDILKTNFRLKKHNERNEYAELNTINLYSDDEMRNPKWLVHPKHGKNVDVIALEVDQKEKYEYHALSNMIFDQEIPPEVGDECYVIGYPFKDFRYLGLPIWKKASIATEPTVNEDQLPKILIDTATRAGLSGSPVFYQKTGIHKLGSNGQLTADTFLGRHRGFLGIYSGRIGDGEIHAQLGIVWKEKVLIEIIEGNIKSDIDFQKPQKEE